MSIKIEFTGYVNKIRQYDWGVVYDMAHNQMQKRGEQWEAVGRDYFSVVGPDGGPQFSENDMVFVRGTLKTKTFDKKDGSKGVALNIRAEQMDRVASKNEVQNRPAAPAVKALWPDVAEIPDEAPF